MRGTLDSGFEFEINNDILDDYDLLEDLIAIDNGEGQRIVSVISKILGPDQEKALKDHLRSENGKLKTSDMATAIGEIFAKLKEDAQTKN